MKMALKLIVSVATGLLLAGCLSPTNPSSNSAKLPAKYQGSVDVGAPVERGVNAANAKGGWTSSESLPPVNTPAAQDYQLEQSEVGAAALPEPPAAPEAPATPEPEMVDGAPTTDQLLREIQAMNKPPPPPAEPPVSIEPRFLPPTPVDPQIANPAQAIPPAPPAAIPAPPAVTPSGSPFPGSVVVDPTPSEPSIPSVEDIADQYRNLNR